MGASFALFCFVGAQSVISVAFGYGVTAFGPGCWLVVMVYCRFSNSHFLLIFAFHSVIGVADFAVYSAG